MAAVQSVFSSLPYNRHNNHKLLRDPLIFLAVTAQFGSAASVNFLLAQ